MATQTLDEIEVTSQQRMTALCESFPVLKGKPGTSPWNQMTFAKWASGGAPTAASRLAAAFVLSVWNGGTPNDGGWWNQRDKDGDGFKYRVGRFDVVEAVARWDHLNQQAFLDWCCNPFWP